MSDRLGGRLYSLILPGMPHVPAELGGMRFFPEHVVVNELVRVLKLPVIDFPMAGPEGNITFIRDCHLKDQDFQNTSHIPYHLTLHEKGKTAAELLTYVINTLVPKGVQASAGDWNTIKANYKLAGEFLYNYGWGNLLEWVLSNEAIDLIYDAGGYDTPYRNWNAAEAMDAFKNTAPGSNAPSFTIGTGMQSLPETLAREFSNKGGEVHMNHALQSLQKIERDGEIKIKLVFAVNEKGNTKTKTVVAKKVILGIPKRSLELLQSDSILFQDKQCMQDIASITSHPAIKLFLGYSYPWWEILGLKGGRSVTDLGIKQIYYFGREERRPNGQKGNTNSLLLGSYTDKNIALWRPLKAGEEYKGLDNPFISPGTSSMPSTNGLTLSQVAQVQQELEAVHALKYIPQPYTGAYMDWGEDPYGGAFSFWNIGVNSATAIKRVRHPIPNIPLYICGDSYSDLQGWIEGALTNTETLLEEHFGLARPSWIPSHYNLGI